MFKKVAFLGVCLVFCWFLSDLLVVLGGFGWVSGGFCRGLLDLWWSMHLHIFEYVLRMFFLFSCFWCDWVAGMLHGNELYSCRARNCFLKTVAGS